MNHYNNVINKKIGWAIGTDVVGVQKPVCNVVAHSDGIVIKVVDYMDGTNLMNDREGWGFGNYVVVLHGQRADEKWIATEYCHLAHINNIKTGQRVSKGQVLGLMGNTGTSYGAHLHFSYRVYSVKPTFANVHDKNIFVWENPENYLNADLPLNIESETLRDTLYYRVQIGAYTVKANAVRCANEARANGFQPIIKFYDGNYRVQVGAYTYKENADKMLTEVKGKGYTDAYVTTYGGTDVSF